METNKLIARLAADATPVRPLAAPWVRMLVWLAISLPYVAAVVLLMPPEVNLAQALRDKQFLVEQAATLATAGMAAIAAFGSVIPGYDRRLFLLPLAPLALGKGPRKPGPLDGPGQLTLRVKMLAWSALLEMAKNGKKLVPSVPSPS